VGEVLFLSGVALGGVVVGLVVGQWWALLAAFLVPVAYIPAGEDSDGMPHWEIALYVFTPPALLGLVVGVGTRRALARSSSARS